MDGALLGVLVPVDATDCLDATDGDGEEARLLLIDPVELLFAT
jgi:hypothetical protein